MKIPILLATVALASTAVGGNVAAQQPADVNFDCALFDECGQAAVPARDASDPAGPAVRQSGSVRGGFTVRRAPAANASVEARPGATTGSSRPVPAVPTAKPGRIARPSVAVPTGRMEAERIRAGQMVTFVSGSATLSPQAKAVAEKLARSMLRPDKASVRYRIEGHTDAVGSREFNLDLSQRRAQAVVAYLATLGVDAKKLEAVGLGFDQPIPGVSPFSASNRRVVAKPIS